MLLSKVRADKARAMSCTLHPEAKAEWNEAVDYYNGCQPDLGLDFPRPASHFPETPCGITRNGAGLPSLDVVTEQQVLIAEV